MKLKSIIVLLVHVLQGCIVDGQTLCKRSSTSEWKMQPTVHVVKWSLTQNICSNFYKECWNIDADHEMNATENSALSNPQLCPLQLQVGDMLFVSSEPSFQSHGMNLANVSSEEFNRCPQQTDIPQMQFIFGCRLSGMHQIDPQWLGIGTHYFAEPFLCNLGLRLNVTVKPHLCQQSPSAPFCSGQGKCLSHVWEEVYWCHCDELYSGQFCQEFDVCSNKPCLNNGSCISKVKKGQRDAESYECICPPSLTGKNCSEIIGQCQPHSCHNGNCRSVSPNTYKCQCNEDSAGKKYIYCKITLNTNLYFAVDINKEFLNFYIKIIQIYKTLFRKHNYIFNFDSFITAGRKLLEENISSEKVEEMIKGLKSEKALGLDGVTSVYYKSYEDLLLPH
ncbi:protein eyes shut homolog [Rhineura floridana]|uniref:protein eyes shut homolog n=1 Tax=Rhineura floridana TaxID=261503 RepID=UPI002AC8167A|nr:protein eyes shut homolog [Rhineura floridana]